MLDASLPRVGRFKGTYRCCHMSCERQSGLFGGGRNSEINISAEMVMHLDEIHVQCRQRCHRLLCLLRGVYDPHVIVRFARWPFEHRPGEYNPWTIPILSFD